MKKILTLLLILALSVSVMVGCDVLSNLGINFGETPNENPDENPNENPGETPEVDADLQLAYNQVHQDAKLIAEITGATYKLPSVAVVGDKSYKVVWTVTDDRIALTPTADGKFVEVVVPEPNEDINYSITFKVTNEKGESLERTYKHVVPKFAYTSFAEYAAAKDDDAVVITGLVSGIFSKTTGSSANGLYIQDLNNEGGYYVYGLTDDPNGVIEVGMTVKVKGVRDTYNGTYEVVKAAVEIVDSTIKPVVPVDYTDILMNAAALNDAALVEKQGMLVTVKGATILEAGDNGYYHFQLGAHKTYLRISSSNNATTKEALETIKTIHGANYGNTADITGIITLYNNNFYLSPVSADMISNIQVVEKSDEEIVDIELGNFKFDTKMYKDATITLLLEGKNYKNVKFAWSTDSEFAVVNGDKLTITVPETDTVVNVKVTATLNDTVKEQTYTIKLSKTVFGVTDAIEFANGQEDGQYTAEKYLFTGIIKNIANDVYGNLYLVDEAGNEIYVYGLYTEDGNGKYETLPYKPVAGDTITIFAIAGKYNGTIQIKSGWLVSYVKGEGSDTPVNPNPDAPATENELTSDKVFATVPVEDSGAFPSYANYNGTYTINGLTITTVDVLRNAHGVPYVFQFKKSSGAFTVSNVTVNSVTIVLVTSYDTFSMPVVTLGGAELTYDSAAVLATKVTTGTNNTSNYEVFRYTITINLDAATTGDLAIKNTSSYAMYLESIKFSGTSNAPVNPNPDPTPDPNPNPDPTPSTTYPIATELKNGDKVIIAAPAYGKILSMVKTSYYNVGVDYSANDFSNVTDDEIFVVTVNADGTYAFTSLSGKVLAMAAANNSLNDAGENTAWVLESKSGTDNIFYLKNNVRGTYIEWYAAKNNWSTYTGTLSDLFELHFYVVESNGTVTPSCEHTNTTTNTVNATCTEKGSTTVTCNDCNKTVSTSEIAALGHNYVDGVCSVCSAQAPTGGAGSYVQVTSAEQFTSGTYVIALTNGIAFSHYDGGWGIGANITAENGVVTDDAGAVLVITVTNGKATIKDKNGNFIAPKGGNSNGMKNEEYSWDVIFNDDGTVTFAGTGDDTVYLAYNSDGAYCKFRGYKTTTCNGDSAKYPFHFIAYKLA